jgi:hypothetical protein
MDTVQDVKRKFSWALHRTYYNQYNTRILFTNQRNTEPAPAPAPAPASMMKNIYILLQK